MAANAFDFRSNALDFRCKLLIDQYRARAAIELNRLPAHKFKNLSRTSIKPLGVLTGLRFELWPR